VIEKTLVMLLLCLLASGQAVAQRKTDVVSMYNGDRITGEIRSLQAGILQFKTDSLGTINVEWQDIANLQSRYKYEIRLSDGERLICSIADADRPGQLNIIAGSLPRSLEWIQVVEMRPIEDHWTDRLDFYLAAGYSYTKASSVQQTTFNTEITYASELSLNTLTGRHARTQQQDDTTRSSRLNFTRSVWTERSTDFRSVWGSFEANDELGLEHRFASGIGLGRFFLDTHRSRWTGVVGLQLLTEQNEGLKEEQAIEAAVSNNLRLWRLDTPELDISFSLNLYPNLSDTGRLRGDTDLRLRWELIEDLFWDVTTYGTYDSDAESDNVWDYGISTGIGWEY
jgi:Protein of unknown function, DUF481